MVLVDARTNKIVALPETMEQLAQAVNRNADLAAEGNNQQYGIEVMR